MRCTRISLFCCVITGDICKNDVINDKITESTFYIIRDTSRKQFNDFVYDYKLATPSKRPRKVEATRGNRYAPVRGMPMCIAWKGRPRNDL